MKSIKIFDTTLRDGAQKENISFSLEDKLKIARLLASFGISYIEAGWPGSNPKDALFYQKVKANKKLRDKIVAFCSTRKKGIKANQDANLKAVVKSKVKYASIVGKTSLLQVNKVLRTSKKENLQMIADSISFLSSKGIKVIFDAEHFFDGFLENPDYALACLQTAAQAGAINLSLCDTNGGCLPKQIEAIVKKVKNQFQLSLGIHTHNDAGTAVANSLIAVESGCSLVQGTINGYGERCGNADLITLMANLQLKMGYKIVSPKALTNLKKLSAQIAEISNEAPDQHQPFVGQSAFTHKGGLHASAVQRMKKSYEHIQPELVGNRSRFVVSELAGQASLKQKFSQWQIKTTPQATALMLKKVKELENQGYCFEAADASLKLLYLRTRKSYRPKFIPLSYQVIIDQEKKEEAMAQATVQIEVRGKRLMKTAFGNGPVNALDKALRQAVVPFYPSLKNVELIDYKVRIPNENDGTAAFTRVLITSKNHKSYWTTVGVSTNIIEASWQALIESLEYFLLIKH